jgi:hypothetical protein
MMAEYTFKETQRFRQIWIWIILFLVNGLSVWAMFFANPPKPTEGWENLVPILILLLVNALFLSLRLKTQINSNSLRFSFFPLLREKSYSFDQIESLEVIEYNPLSNYGGWGIRFNFDSWAYTTGGNFGIMVNTKSKKFLLGTQKPEEAKKAIAHFFLFKSENHGG